MVARTRTTKRKPASRTATTRRSTAKKTTARKTTAKKTTARKTTARKTTAKKTNRSGIRTAWTKTQVMSNIADSVELTKKQVSAVFEELNEIISQHIRKGAAGEFTIPGIAKIVTKKKPARKARKGTNPFTGEEMMFKAKPASVTVKIRPLKKVKDMVA